MPRGGDPCPRVASPRTCPSPPPAACSPPVALLHGSGIDRDTATALIDAVAYLTSTGDIEGADALIRLVTTDPDTIAAAHVALRVPARRPNSTAPTREPLPPPAPLPRRIPSPYRDPAGLDVGAGGDVTAPGTGPNPTTTTSDLGPWLASTAGPGGAEELPLSETRRWREATIAQVLLLDYAVPGTDGQVTGVYTPVPIVHPPGWCDHLDTICGDCLAGWSEDHAVAVFRHGIDGAAAGCRCPLCRTTIPDRSSGHDR